MSFPYTTSADSISVRLVWIIWGEGKHEELGSPGPVPPGQVDGEIGLIRGYSLHQHSAQGLALPTSPHTAGYSVTSAWPMAKFPSTQKKEAALAVTINGISPTWWDQGVGASGARNRQCRHRVGAAVSEGQTDLGKPVPWQNSPMGSPHAAPWLHTFPCPKMSTVSLGFPILGPSDPSHKTYPGSSHKNCPGSSHKTCTTTGCWSQCH